MKTAIYARVSTTDKGQDPELQLRPLREYCQARGLDIAAEYIETTSGAKDRRPQLDDLMDAARKRQIDLIAVWKLDRFGRSLKHLVTAIDELQQLGVGFISYSENIDLTTASGRLMFQIIGAMAEFERELIKERVRAGLANAKAKGRKNGRKPLAPIDIKRVIEAYELDPTLSVRQLAKTAKMPAATTGKLLKAYKQGFIDRDGFRYDEPLFPVSKTPLFPTDAEAGNTAVFPVG